MRVVIATADVRLGDGLAAEFQKFDEVKVVSVARNGADVLEYIREFLPDLILADLVLAKYDGLALLELLPSLRPEKVPRIFLMAMKSQEKIAKLAMAKGAAGIVNKPVSSAAVRALITEAGRMRTAERGYGRFIHVIMDEIGVPRHLLGYVYLYEAVAMTVENRDMLSRLTTAVYPYIAKKFASSKSRVERSMRFAVESAWNRGRVDKIEEMFGYTVRSDVGRPTNGEFIAMAAERVKLLGGRLF